MSLILASQSPRRKEILSCLVSDFAIIPSDIDEEAFARLARSPEELVTRVAQAKAKKLIPSLKEGDVVLTSDTVVVLSESIDSWHYLGKAKDNQNAREALLSLRGREHFVYTSIYLFEKKTGKELVTFDRAKLIFKEFDLERMESYLQTDKWQDKAGSYGLQDIKDIFLDKYEGNYSPILGLPAGILAEMLPQVGVNIFADWQQRLQKQLGSEN